MPYKQHKINFIGNTQVGMTGEIADEVLLVNSLRKHKQIVNFIPRDVWREHCRGEVNEEWNQYLDLKSDINIICKWHAFDDRMYISKLREESGAKVLYWVWDWMDGFPHSHKDVVLESDLYLGNDVMHPQYDFIPNKYYFPFDVADENISPQVLPKQYDVTFFGSCIGQGLRKDWLPKIAEYCSLKVFSPNSQDWLSFGLDAEPAVWGDDFATKVAESKIILQFSVDDSTWGYWSNRVGKVLTLGGFLLAHYAPGMELFLRDGVAYFNTIEECKQKISYYLNHDSARQKIAARGFLIGRERFTIDARIRDLLILIERLI